MENNCENEEYTGECNCQETCEVCGKGEEYCAFEHGCSCWYGKPCEVNQ